MADANGTLRFYDESVRAAQGAAARIVTDTVPVVPVAPAVAGVAPAPGTPITATTRLVFDVTCASALRRVLVVVEYPTAGVTELAHDGDAFTAPYRETSTRAAVAGGFRYSLLRSPAWPASPKVTPFAYSVNGGENA